MWKEIKDDKGRTYYYDTVNKKSQWERPAELVKPVTADKEPVLPKDWKSAKTKEGKVYYYNVKTKKSQWDIPKETESKVETVVKPEAKAATVEKKDTTSADDDENKYGSKSVLMKVKTTSKDEAEPLFMAMLKEYNVDATWSFSRIIHELATKDARYWLVDNDPLWKQQMFNKYLDNRTEEQLLKEHSEINKFQNAFKEMLKGKSSEIDYSTTWNNAKRLISSEPIYSHSVVSEQEKKKCYDEYIMELRQQYEQEHHKLKEQALIELRGYLQSIIHVDQDEIPPSWHTMCNQYLFDKNKRYMANKHFVILTREDVLKEYIVLVQQIDARIVQNLHQIESENYSRDRYARDKFKELLKHGIPNLVIRATTKWSDIYPLIKGESAFLNLVGRRGSTPIDLFLDLVEEKYIIVCGLRSIGQQVLIDTQFEWSTDDNINTNGITQILRQNVQFKDVDDLDLEIVVKEIIKARKDMLQEQKAQELYHEKQSRHAFKEMLMNHYIRMNSTPASTWEESQHLFKGTMELMQLTDNTVRESIYNEVRQMIIDQKPHNTETTTTRGKKRPLEPTIALDY
ncbi:similar to Saccharomyces cerevisiae YKL012W PRP40 U1 snRNP protein involved in splicing [Maudiozyma saulgeensis]|uniref:Similar to Saccharomyces cerevisiae YKL012W PRP40 U1 snRNP protein involved in splicing n=1 Tax=Maudiozyma saulgeensis TaxID=1789683 RepID=A0A1X7RAG9_9SACH|nr:similar to Saccharomyces cerevisiae YKL012W PRP40 U1 snRNP protein involved in splicing [Kazachstania saulgeensis]